MDKGYPDSEEGFLKKTIDGIEVFFSSSIQPLDEEEGITVFLSKVMFIKSLEVAGIKCDIQLE